MRLIDADALIKDLGKRWNVNDDQDFCNKEVWRGIEEAPTIDAVPVVRCKDCKYAHITVSGECKYCDFWQDDDETQYEALYLDGDFFCVNGERKDDGET